MWEHGAAHRLSKLRGVRLQRAIERRMIALALVTGMIIGLVVGITVAR